MYRDILTLSDVALNNKRVVIREDFNVPIENGVILNDLRIKAAVPGIKQALAANATVSLLSHLGRPEAGTWEEKYSLQPVAERLQQIMNFPVTFVANGLEPVHGAKLVLYENVRFLKGEVENDPKLAQQMAKLGDVFVMDAFGSAHRAHASTAGIAEYMPIAVAGPLLLKEISALDRIMLQPERPVVAIIGGAKVSSKLAALNTLVGIVDVLMIGGAMANTLLAAQGYEVGKSLYEPDLIPAAQRFLNYAQQQNCKIILPTDAVIADGSNVDLKSVTNNDNILDIGSASVANFITAFKDAKTILWNGPVGLFQNPLYASGTKQIALALANSKAFTVVGGGESITALEEYGVLDKITYVSTGGGAFLEYLEGKSLPAILALNNKIREKHA